MQICRKLFLNHNKAAPRIEQACAYIDDARCPILGGECKLLGKTIQHELMSAQLDFILISSLQYTSFLLS